MRIGQIWSQKNLCICGLMHPSLPVHPILMSLACSPSELITSSMSNKPKTPLLSKSTALPSPTYCGLMSSLTDMLTSTASSQVTTPSTQMCITLRPLETLTSPSTTRPDHHTLLKISGHTATGSFPSNCQGSNSLHVPSLGEGT